MNRKICLLVMTLCLGASSLVASIRPLSAQYEVKGHDLHLIDDSLVLLIDGATLPITHLEHSGSGYLATVIVHSDNLYCDVCGGIKRGTKCDNPRCPTNQR